MLNIKVVGLAGSGKTALIKRMLDKVYSSPVSATKGLVLQTRPTKDLAIYDMPGGVIIEEDVLGADAILYIFDGSNAQGDLTSDIKLIQQLLAIEGLNNTPVFFAISKNDEANVNESFLYYYQGRIEKELMAIFTQKIACPLVSAKENSGVKELLDNMLTLACTQPSENVMDEDYDDYGDMTPLLLPPSEFKEPNFVIACLTSFFNNKSKVTQPIIKDDTYYLKQLIKLRDTLNQEITSVLPYPYKQRKLLKSQYLTKIIDTHLASEGVANGKGNENKDGQLLNLATCIEQVKQKTSDQDKIAIYSGKRVVNLLGEISLVNNASIFNFSLGSSS
jgi:GTPase SAR1 family protein